MHLTFVLESWVVLLIFYITYVCLHLVKELNLELFNDSYYSASLLIYIIIGIKYKSLTDLKIFK